jgi:hypothetical protein
MVAACGGGSSTLARHTASSSPSAVASATASPSGAASPSGNPTPSTAPTPPPPPPAAASGAYGVLVTNASTNPYTVSIVSPDGRVAGSAQSSTPVVASCGNAAAALVPPPLSTSNSSVYFMDAAGYISRMSYDGFVVHNVAVVPAPTATRRAIFSVSPNDGRIAVVVADYSPSGAATSLYVADLDGHNHQNIFSESGPYTLWPVGWHGNLLVLAKEIACTPGGGPLCCGPQEFHVVDPATGQRLQTLGGGSCGTVVGPPSPGGVLCETSEISYNSVDWQGNSVIIEWISGLSSKVPAYLSPNGQEIAVTMDGTNTRVWKGNYNSVGPFAMLACGWIDDSHVLAGGDAQQQPRIANIATGQITPVAAIGDCAGRIPGGL